MISEATSELLVRWGFPLFWIGVGAVQWFWPAAIFSGASNEAVTPGARGFAVLWLLVGSALGLVFVPALGGFGGLFVPGAALLGVGLLQWGRPAWSSPAPESVSDRTLGALFAVCGGIVIGVSAMP